MNMPPDDPNDPNGPYGHGGQRGFAPPGFGDPYAGGDASLQGDLALKKKTSKRPFIIGGVVVVGTLGFLLWQSMQRQQLRELHAATLKQFADIEKEDVVGKFWSCAIGPGVDPGTFPNNLALSQRLEGAFAMDPKNFPAKVREECTPKAIDAKRKIEAIKGPPEYDPAFKAYAQSLADLSKAFDEWSKIVPSHLAEKEVGNKVATYGSAWHSFAGGKPGADVIAFDRFLHCAVPTIDKVKDGQAVVEYLFKQCKDPKYVDRLQNVCGKEVLAEGIPQTPTKGFKVALKKLQADDRELSAFDDCLRKARKSKRTDDSEAVGHAWKAYVDAGAKVREIGKAALSDK